MTKTQQLVNQHLSNLQPKFDFSLAEKTYFKIGGPAEVYLEINKKDDLIRLIKLTQQHNIRLTVLGGASNVIIDDLGVGGIVVKITATEISLLENNQIKAHAGIKMATLVSQSVQMGLTGLEYFLGVPGTLGGAIYNNAHYLQDLISTHVFEVEVINQSGEIVRLDQNECQFDYDSSRFQQTKEIIWSVVFTLKKGNQEESKELIKKSTLYRAQTQPLGEPSSGCIFQNVKNNSQLKKLFPQFKNNEYISGGFLIDQAGLKGEHINDIYVSDIHAAFLVNKGKGTSADVLKMIEKIKKVVKEKFGVELCEEVFYLH